MLANKQLRNGLFAGIAILGGGLIAYLFQNPLFEKNLEAACQGTPRKVHFTIQPDFYLNKRFLESPNLSSADVTAFADYHLRFTYQTLQNFDKSKTPRFAVVPATEYKISKIKIENSKYPLALEIWRGNIFQDFFSRAETEPGIDYRYMNRALQAGSTTTDDEAFHISYEADMTMYACENSDQKLSDSLSLPVDPLLAFWSIPEKKLETRFHEIFKTDFKASPCAVDEFMNDFDPYYFWYYWSLNAKGCQAALTQNAVKTYPLLNLKEVSLETEKPFDLSFLDAIRGRPLKVSVNFTLIDDNSIIVPDRFGTVVGETIPELIQTEKFTTVRNKLEYLSNYDIALQTGIIFAWSMRKISSEFHFEQIALEEMLLQWRLTGKFKESQQPYDMTINIGSTIPTNPGYDVFYAALQKGFAESDIVYFGGHSGVGKNLSENRLREGFEKFRQSSTLQHQLVMLMTCFSAHYFAPSTFPMTSQKNFVRDIIYTGSLPSGYDARVLTGLMTQADRYFEKGHHLNFTRWPKAFKADAFFIHKTQK